MNAMTLARMGVRIAGVLQLLLGLVIWTGRADSLISVHMLVGIVFVLSLWSVAYLAARAGAGTGLAAVAFVVGLALPILGVTQAGLLPGSSHWIVQVVHVGLGVVAIGLGEMLGTQAARTEETAEA